MSTDLYLKLRDLSSIYAARYQKTSTMKVYQDILRYICMAQFPTGKLTNPVVLNVAHDKQNFSRKQLRQVFNDLGYSVEKIVFKGNVSVYLR